MDFRPTRLRSRVSKQAGGGDDSFSHFLCGEVRKADSGRGGCFSTNKGSVEHARNQAGRGVFFLPDSVEVGSRLFPIILLLHFLVLV